MKKHLVVLLVVGVSLLLTSCGNNLPYWKIAEQGEDCFKSVIVEKYWNGKTFYQWNNSDNSFNLLVQKNNGELGVVDVTPYQYIELKTGDFVCIIP